MSEFDAYKDTYRDEVEQSIGFIGQGLDYFIEAKARALLDLAERRLGAPDGLTALDVGCGTGQTDRFLDGRFAELVGVDPSPASLERARELNPSVRYLVGDGRAIPLDEASVDVAFAICVMHHVPTADWDAVAGEMRRVVRPGGLVAIFEHNPYNPLTRRAVSSCVFDEDAVLLSRRRAARLLRSAGLDVVEQRYILFVPGGGSRVASFERLLAGVPVGAQHYVAGRVPVSAAGP